MTTTNTNPTNPDPAGFGVYIHWPFCASKCPYCDFNSHVRHGGVDQEAFADAYVREIEETAARTGPRTISSIFFGGGTPSLMAAETVGRLLETVARCWHVADDAEVTLEANPSSVEAARFAGYRAAGVNRVSIGVQALNDDDLRRLGRLHSLAEAEAALNVANRTFDRVSFDLIYARPGQNADDWRNELRRALAMSSGHLSSYQLTIEEGTPFAELHRSGRLKTPPSRLADTLYQITQEETEAAGLLTYEISNHARTGEESRHNLLYWRYGEFAGIGPGAHGRLILEGVRTATAAERSPEQWRAAVAEHGHGWIAHEALSPSEQADEALLMGLRLREGIDPERLAAVGAVALDPDKIGELVASGHIEVDRVSGRIAATRKGRFILNALVLQLSSGFRPSPTPRSPDHPGRPDSPA